MKLEIKNRWTGAVLFTHEGETIRDAVIAATKAGADLSGADLRDAYLRGADLRGAYLSGADLSDAYLRGADLSDAYLRGADLSGADLSDAYLSGADLSDADLSGADLSDAYLSGADLSDAYLSGADLSGADLSDAYLRGAYLRGADLRGAYLSDAYLRCADLRDAYLSGADLRGAYLSGAYLRGADLRGADLRGAYLSGAYLRGARNVPPPPAPSTEPREPFVRKRRTSAERAADYRARHPEVPVVEHLDQRILDAISAPGCKLEMSNWHSCETTHCRAGWAIHLGGEAGYELERKLGDPLLAGRAIYIASTGRSANFFASNEAALADLKRRAEMAAKGEDT